LCVKFLFAGFVPSHGKWPERLFVIFISYKYQELLHSFAREFRTLNSYPTAGDKR